MSVYVLDGCRLQGCQCMYYRAVGYIGAGTLLNLLFCFEGFLKFWCCNIFDVLSKPEACIAASVVNVSVSVLTAYRYCIALSVNTSSECEQLHLRCRLVQNCPTKSFKPVTGCYLGHMSC